MKILYIGSEQSGAQAVATALRGIAQNVAVSWASRPEHVAKWLDQNQDLAAVVLDTRTNRDSQSTTGREQQSPFDGLPKQATRDSLEQKLEHATAALQDAEQRHRSAMTGAERRLAELQAQYEISMARATATWEMVDEQLRAAAIEVGRARQDQAAAAADVDRLSRQVSELSTQLADAAATHIALDNRLADALTARDAANARTEDVRRAAAEQAAERQREFEAQLAHESEQRRCVEDLLANAVSARDDAERRHASATSDVERLTRRETDLSAIVADLTTIRHDLERRLAATEAAFEDATTRATRDRLAASKKAAEREAELDGQLRQERTTRTALEQAIADADAALRAAQERYESALAQAATELAERQAHFDRELSEVTSARDRFLQQLQEVQVARDQLQDDCHSTAVDVERLTLREQECTSQIAELQTVRDSLERQLAEAARAITDASAREADLVGQIAQERAWRSTLENAVAAAEAELRVVQERHESALAQAATELAERQAHFDRECSQSAADRDRLTQRLNEAESALGQIRVAHQSATAEVERLTQLGAELACRLDDIKAARDTVEARLADATTAISRADAHAAGLAEQLRQEHERCVDLEKAVADAGVALRTAQQTHDAALAAAASELLEREAQLGRELSQTVSDRDHLVERLRDAEATLDQVRRDHESSAAEVERLTKREAELTSQQAGLQAARETLELQLAASARAIADADERLACERAAAADREKELAHNADTLRAKGLEREAHFEVLLAQEQLEHENRLADLQGRNRELALERDTIQYSLATIQEQSQQLREKLAVTTEELAVTTRRNEALQAEASQLPQLREQLDQARAESHRLFEHAGLAMFRCAPDGVLIHANRACITLIGRRTLDEMRGVQFGSAVFEAPDVLSWLIERCTNTRAKESLETTWRRADGGRLFVRLSARSLTSDAIEVVAEDLTRLRILQERLGQAHRMEAVGRFASEVAVTCDNLLNDIHQNGQEWLATAGFDAGSRQQGELLLDEVRRASEFLQQLAAFGDEQARTPMLVDLNALIRDLEPVLRRVAGNDVEIELRDTSSPLNVDVQTERVERLLVTLASYGRGRMPYGGRLRIELTTIVVDRHFAAKHPNVRLGLHALITVTEIKTGPQAERVKKTRDGSASHQASAKVPVKPGVDFGTLQKLVSQCRGHLWMKVHPVGEMVAKIRLPLASSREQMPWTRPGTRISQLLRTNPRHVTNA